METSKMSYVHNSGSQKELLYTTIPSMLDSRAREHPDNECHVFLNHNGSDSELKRVAITWRDLEQRSLKMAAALIDMGLKPGDRIAIFGRSIPEWLYVEYACTRIKLLLIPVPVSLMYSDKLASFLSDHRVQLLVLDPGYDSDIVQKISLNVSGFDSLMKTGESTIPSGYPLRVLFLDGPVEEWRVQVVADLLEPQLQEESIKSIKMIQNSIDPDDPAVIYATSGSTGIPKLIIHSHFTLINGMFLWDDFMVLSSNQSFFNDRGFGWLGSIHYYGLLTGATRVHLSTASTSHDEYARIALDVIHRENIYMAFLLTYVLHELRKMLKAGELSLPSSLKIIGTGGEKIPIDIPEYFGKLTNVCIGYASSETIVLGLLSTDKSPYTVGDGEDQQLAYQVVGSIQVKMVDEEGRCVPRGIPGFIQTRHPYLFLGYLDDPEATSAAFSHGGWFGSGDRALMHEDGRYEVLGRTTDLIIKGTIKIYPSKQEEMLLRHEKVARAAVCSIPDAKYNQEICACVQPKPGCDVTVEELREHCRQFQPLGMSVPLYPFYYKIVAELPINTTGKLDKVLIRKMFMEMASDN